MASDIQLNAADEFHPFVYGNAANVSMLWANLKSSSLLLSVVA
jgi:hypothetical protein